MGTRLCPYCAEEIQEEAILCKHCRSSLAGTVNPVQPDVIRGTAVSPETPASPHGFVAEKTHTITDWRVPVAKRYDWIFACIIAAVLWGIIAGAVVFGIRQQVAGSEDAEWDDLDLESIGLSESRIEYATYTNHRFGYSVDIPIAYKLVSEAENGDGAVFQSPDGTAELRVFGSWNAEDWTPEDICNMSLDFGEAGNGLMLRVVKENWYAVSWLQEDMIHYEKGIVNSDRICGFILEYPADAQDDYEPLISHLVETLTQ